MIFRSGRDVQASPHYHFRRATLGHLAACAIAAACRRPMRSTLCSLTGMTFFLFFSRTASSWGSPGQSAARIPQSPATGAAIASVIEQSRMSMIIPSNAHTISSSLDLSQLALRKVNLHVHVLQEIQPLLRRYPMSWRCARLRAMKSAGLSGAVDKKDIRRLCALAITLLCHPDVLEILRDLVTESQLLSSTSQSSSVMSVPKYGPEWAESPTSMILAAHSSFSCPRHK